MVRKVSLLAVLLSLVAFSSAGAGDKTGQANIEMCKRFYSEVVNGGNIDLLDELLVEDFVEHEEFPGLVQGREGCKQFFTMFRKAFPDLNFNVEFYVADEDKVAAYLTMTGTHKGEFMGMPPTGKKISVRTVDIIRIKDGKAVEHWGVTDTGSMMEQLGMMASAEDHKTGAH